MLLALFLWEKGKNAFEGKKGNHINSDILQLSL